VSFVAGRGALQPTKQHQITRWQKLQLYLLKNTGEEPIRGTIIRNQEENTDARIWSVYDFLCVVANKSTKTNHGRIMFKRLKETHEDKLKSKCIPHAFEDEPTSPTMDTADLM
jgi:hypothetical protein